MTVRVTAAEKEMIETLAANAAAIYAMANLSDFTVCLPARTGRAEAHVRIRSPEPR